MGQKQAKPKYRVFWPTPSFLISQRDQESLAEGISNIQTKLAKLEHMLRKQELNDFESQTDSQVESKQVQTVSFKKHSKASQTDVTGEQVSQALRMNQHLQQSSLAQSQQIQAQLEMIAVLQQRTERRNSFFAESSLSRIGDVDEDDPASDRLVHERIQATLKLLSRAGLNKLCNEIESCESNLSRTRDSDTVQKQVMLIIENYIRTQNLEIVPLQDYDRHELESQLEAVTQYMCAVREVEPSQLHLYEQYSDAVAQDTLESFFESLLDLNEHIATVLASHSMPIDACHQIETQITAVQQYVGQEEDQHGYVADHQPVDNLVSPIIESIQQQDKLRAQIEHENSQQVADALALGDRVCKVLMSSLPYMWKQRQQLVQLLVTDQSNVEEYIKQMQSEPQWSVSQLSVIDELERRNISHPQLVPLGEGVGVWSGNQVQPLMLDWEPESLVLVARVGDRCLVVKDQLICE